MDQYPGWKGRPPAKFIRENVAVNNGCLQISTGILPKPEGDFTISGGAVQSRSHEAFYGYYEARMKASKVSMSSTFWLSGGRKREAGGDVSLEIDIVETIGAPQGEPAWATNWHRQMNCNTHYFHRVEGKKEDIDAGNKAPVDPPVGETFHTYGACWVDANTINFYLDDEYQFTVHPATNYSATPFDRPLHVNMVCETYDWMQPPSHADLTNSAINTARYDWVRAWTLVGTNTAEEGVPGGQAPGQSGSQP